MVAFELLLAKIENTIPVAESSFLLREQRIHTVLDLDGLDPVVLTDLVYDVLALRHFGLMRRVRDLSHLVCPVLIP